MKETSVFGVSAALLSVNMANSRALELLTATKSLPELYCIYEHKLKCGSYIDTF